MVRPMNIPKKMYNAEKLIFELVFCICCCFLFFKKVDFVLDQAKTYLFARILSIQFLVIYWTRST